MSKIDVFFNAEVAFDVNKLTKQFDTLLDDTTMLEIYNLWGKMIEPWVPMDTGILAHGYEVTPQALIYPGPYAHYQYMGIVYGPNIPIFEDGELVGFRSPPGKGSKSPKVPYQELVYSTEKHPLASKEWDKAAWATIRDSFVEGVRQILIRRLQNG